MYVYDKSNNQVSRGIAIAFLMSFALAVIRKVFAYIAFHARLGGYEAVRVLGAG